MFGHYHLDYRGPDVEIAGGCRSLIFDFTEVLRPAEGLVRCPLVLDPELELHLPELSPWLEELLGVFIGVGVLTQ